MVDDYGEFVKRRRHILGMSQRDLAEKAGVKQPLIAAIERGRRSPSVATRAALDDALALRPSTALAARRDAVRATFRRMGLADPLVFGSVARRDDDFSSDVDLLVQFSDAHDIVDLLELEDELERILTVHVDVVDARASGGVVAHARAQAVEL